MATEVPAAFDSESLRGEMHAALSGEAPEAPVAASPEPPAEPAAPAPDVTVAEPSEPQQLAEGSPPADASQPAVEDPDSADLKRAAEMVGVDPSTFAKLDPEVRKAAVQLAKWGLGANNRAGEAGRELKALKRAIAPEKAKEIEDEEAFERALQTTPEQPERLEPDVEGVIETRVNQLAEQDQECRVSATKYHELGRQIGALVAKDESGRYVGYLPQVDAELSGLERNIDSLEALLDPERSKLLGVPIDEIQRPEIEMRLARMQSRAVKLDLERSRALREVESLQSQRGRARDDYYQHRDRIKEGIVGRYNQQRHEADREERIKQGAKDFEKEYRAEFASALTSQKVPADLKAELWEYLKAQAKAVEVVENVKPFIETHTKGFLATLDKHHRIKAKEYATLKTADATPASPTGPGAVAAQPAPSQTQDWEADLERMQREARFGRR